MLRKKTLTIFWMLLLCGITCTGVFAARQDMPSADAFRVNQDEALDDILFKGNPIYSWRDFKNGYADIGWEAAVILPESREGDPPANLVIGGVVDFDTNTCIPGASVYMNGELLLTTGTDGKFRIENLPDGVYNWEVRADGFQPGTYTGYEVDHYSGTTTFTFYISTDRETHFTRQIGMGTNRIGTHSDGTETVHNAAPQSMSAPPVCTSDVTCAFSSVYQCTGIHSPE